MSLSSADALCEEGKLALEKLLKFMIHPAISSINLTTVLGSLATVARQRPMFMSEVVQAYETLHGGRLSHGIQSQFKTPRLKVSLLSVNNAKHFNGVHYSFPSVLSSIACIDTDPVTKIPCWQFDSFSFQHIPLYTLLFVANLPPTLAKSQVSSVRKNLKLHLVSVLKHPCSLEFQAQIGTLLLDLGMPQSEITRSTPALREPRKRPRHEQYTEGKKIKMGESSCSRFRLLWSLHEQKKCPFNAEPGLMEDDDDKEEPVPLVLPKPAAVAGAQSAIDLTAEFLRPLLNPENVANLVSGDNHVLLLLFKCGRGANDPPALLSQVLISMVYLPDVMPASFQATYTPVESAGTDAQIKHLARLMATQMTAAEIGPGWPQRPSA